ncbi:hypothetical protein HDU86_007553 [Geranomyces michiganensis]|nr:hypothetical protein HDU86_007553 [Geranomyces michiganensis]
MRKATFGHRKERLNKKLDLRVDIIPQTQAVTLISSHDDCAKFPVVPSVNSYVTAVGSYDDFQIALETCGRALDQFKDANLRASQKALSAFGDSSLMSELAQNCPVRWRGQTAATTCMDVGYIQLCLITTRNFLTAFPGGIVPNERTLDFKLLSTFADPPSMPPTLQVCYGGHWVIHDHSFPITHDNSSLNLGILRSAFGPCHLDKLEHVVGHRLRYKRQGVRVALWQVDTTSGYRVQPVRPADQLLQTLQMIGQYWRCGTKNRFPTASIHEPEYGKRKYTASGQKSESP